MKSLNVIYWSRVGFGIVAAIMCTILGSYMGPSNLLLNGMTIAILIYIVTYYILKALYMTRVEKLSKVFTMGIGAYFLTWIVAWVLFLTVTQTL